MNSTMSTPPPTRLASLEYTIEKGMATFVEVGLSLLEIQRDKLYPHATFEAYCQERWGWSASRGRQMMEAAIAVQGLPDGVTVPTEGAARELVKVPPPRRAAVVVAAIRQAAGGVPTAKGIAVAAKADAEVDRTVYDKTGFPVPESLLDTFRRMEEIQGLLSAISRVRGALRSAQETEDKLFSEVNFSSALADLANAYAQIRLALPHAVCPTCQGRRPSTCAVCGKDGFVSEFFYTSCIDAAVREIREKSAQARIKK